MPIRKIRACSNSDTSTIVWQTDKIIPECRGFALERQVKGQSSTTMVPTWVGFKGQQHKQGASNPSDVWPIQRYIWSDFLVQPGQTVCYRAIPMVRNNNGRLEKAAKNLWSAWTDWVTIWQSEFAALAADRELQDAMQRAAALWAAEALYLRFDARDAAPWHTMSHRDDHLWEEEVVEIFLDPDRSGRDYAELEISPGNVVCDVRMVSPSPNKQMDLSWNLEGLETRVVPWRDRGRAVGWTALARLPWEGFRSLPSSARVALPPRAGDRWRFNLFRIERPGGKEHPDKEAVEAAWSPTGEPSFHVPAAFRDLVFAGGGTKPTPRR